MTKGFFYWFSAEKEIIWSKKDKFKWVLSYWIHNGVNFKNRTIIEEVMLKKPFQYRLSASQLFLELYHENSVTHSLSVADI